MMEYPCDKLNPKENLKTIHDQHEKASNLNHTYWRVSRIWFDEEAQWLVLPLMAVRESCDIGKIQMKLGMLNLGREESQERGSGNDELSHLCFNTQTVFPLLIFHVITTLFFFNKLPTFIKDSVIILVAFVFGPFSISLQKQHQFVTKVTT